MKKCFLGLVHPRFIRGIHALLYRTAKLRWSLPSAVKIELLSPVDWSTYNEIFVNAEYDAALTKAFSNLASGEATMKVLDLGANVGFFLLRLLDRLKMEDRSAKVLAVAIEPDPVNAGQLRSRLNQQPPQIRQILQETIIVGAVGQRAGTSTLYESHNYHAHSLLEQQKYVGAKGTTVEYVDLDALFPGEHWDLVKCDIEGSEQAFVQNYGDLLSRSRVLVLELHKYACDMNVMRPLLLEAGFDEESCVADHGKNALYVFWRSKEETAVQA
jgi:FkbM family methyltransferase